MAAQELEERGVTVEQRFREDQPTINQPTLPTCIVGPLMEIIQAVEDDGSRNDSAAPQGPAVVQFAPVNDKYMGLASETLELIVNRGAPVSVTFPASPTDFTPNEVARIIRDAAIPGLVVSTEALPNGDRAVVLTTSREGSDAHIQIGQVTTSGAETAFGIAAGVSYEGVGDIHSPYSHIVLRKESLPDPHGRLKSVRVDWDSLMVFLDLGDGTLRPLSKDSARYRSFNTALVVVNDGDGDSTSPLIQFPETIDDPVAPVQVVGNVDATGVDYSNDVQGKTLVMRVDGGPFQSVTFGAGVTDAATFIQAIEKVWGVGSALLSTPDDYLILSSTIDGGAQSIVEISPTSTLDLSTVFGIAPGRYTLFSGNTNAAPYPIAVGDEIWETVSGQLVGVVAEVAPGGNSDMVRLDREHALTKVFDARSYVVAKGVDTPTATRPGAELRVIGSGDSAYAVIDPVIVYSSGGTQDPILANFKVLVSYKGLRLDVTPADRNVGLIRVSDVKGLEENYGPITPENPLAYALSLALLSSQNTETFAIGVDEVTATSPEGTVEAYARAFEVLEHNDPYVVVPLSQDRSVHELADTHVSLMSEPRMRGERIAIVNIARPTRKTDRLIASGLNANQYTVPSNTLDTGLAMLESMLVSAGFDPGTLTEDDGVFLEIMGDPNRYLLSSVSAGVVTVNAGPLSFSNDFFSDFGGGNAFTAQVIDRPFTVKVKGADLESRNEEAEAYGDIAKEHGNRRVVATMPDTVVTRYGSIDLEVPGYFAAAAVAGMISGGVQGTPLSGLVVPGLSDVRGSSGYFGSQALRILSGSGLFVLEKEDPTRSEVTVRHQVTTDTSSLKTRELSITVQVDYVAKVIRDALREYTRGRNITVGVMDELNVVLDGAIDFLVNTKKVVKDIRVLSFIQSQESPDDLELDAEVEVLYPLNRIKIRLYI